MQSFFYGWRRIDNVHGSRVKISYFRRNPLKSHVIRQPLTKSSLISKLNIQANFQVIWTTGTFCSQFSAFCPCPTNPTYIICNKWQSLDLSKPRCSSNTDGGNFTSGSNAALKRSSDCLLNTESDPTILAFALEGYQDFLEVSYFGSPVEIGSDRVSSFMSEMLQEYLPILHTQESGTPNSYPVGSAM